MKDSIFVTCIKNISNLMVMKFKNQYNSIFNSQFLKFKRNMWPKFVLIVTGLGATIWFLIRVIPKPSRASYPCQRAAFPIASSFVLWLIGLFTIKPLITKIENAFPRQV